MDDSSLGGGDELLRSISKSPGFEMLTDALDLSVDQFLESGVVRDVPVVGWVVKVAGIAISIRDRMFAKKLVAFLAGTSTASAEKIAAFLDDLAEPKRRERAGEILMLLIERHERIEKSAILGRLLAAQIEGRFDGERFLALAAALDRTSIGELLLVRRAVTAGHLGTEEVIWAVARTGLVNVELIGAPVGPGIKTSYQVNSLGGDMVAFGLTGLADDADTGFP